MEMRKVELEWSLLALRLTIFLVMLIWTFDKFMNPGHAAKVYENFYFIGGMESMAIFMIGLVEIVILLGFIAGLFKKHTYGLVLLLHAISTLSSYKQYLAPYDGVNILFFAAWPMLAACLALYLLRDYHTKFVLGR